MYYLCTTNLFQFEQLMELFYNLTMKKLLSVLLFMGLAMVTEAQELYKIYSTKQQKQVAIEDVVNPRTNTHFWRAT
jgi:hypothetical protein